MYSLWICKEYCITKSPYFSRVSLPNCFLRLFRSQWHSDHSHLPPTPFCSPTVILWSHSDGEGLQTLHKGHGHMPCTHILPLQVCVEAVHLYTPLGVSCHIELAASNTYNAYNYSDVQLLLFNVLVYLTQLNQRVLCNRIRSCTARHHVVHWFADILVFHATGATYPTVFP